MITQLIPALSAFGFVISLMLLAISVRRYLQYRRLARWMKRMVERTPAEREADALAEQEASDAMDAYADKVVTANKAAQLASVLMQEQYTDDHHKGQG